MNGRNLLFSAINKVIFAKGAFPENINEETLKELYITAKKQDFGHIAAVAVKDIAKGNAAKLYEKEKLLAVYRREQLDFTETEVCGLLAKQGIKFMLLKGGVIKNFYPEKWMRTASDIDILVKKDAAERALNALLDAGYEYKEKSDHDYHIYSKNGVHIELQYDFSIGSKKCDLILQNVWEDAVVYGDGLRMSNEFLVFYNLAHAYHHFIWAGCGIKPFADHIILENNLNYDNEAFFKLIKKSGLEDFYKGFTLLCGVWFNNESHTKLTKQMEDYIFSGGVYGTAESWGRSQSAKNGSGKYILSRIFKPRKDLETQFPNLKKHGWLLPYYQVRRWFNLFSKSKRKLAKSEMDGILTTEDFGEMFKNLGI